MFAWSVCLWTRSAGKDNRASPIAQLVERAAVNLKVAGSNPAGRDSFTAPCAAKPHE